MNLKKKKQLAARTLGVGINRIKFNTEGLPEIKEAITKQDMKTLFQEGIIFIKPVKGRRKFIKRKTRKGAGKIKFKIKNRKKIYVKITRKLRKYIIQQKNQKIISKELYYNLRKKIKNRSFKSLSGLKDYIDNLEKLKVKQSEKKEKIKAVRKKEKPTNVAKKSKGGRK